MSEMIERVADAIEAQMRTSDNYPEDLARAAINAMRDFNTEDFSLTEAAGSRRLIDDKLVRHFGMLLTQPGVNASQAMEQFSAHPDEAFAAIALIQDRLNFLRQSIRQRAIHNPPGGGGSSLGYVGG